MFPYKYTDFLKLSTFHFENSVLILKPNALVPEEKPASLRLHKSLKHLRCFSLQYSQYISLFQYITETPVCGIKALEKVYYQKLPSDLCLSIH